MVNLAKERNIEYTPSHESCQALGAYCLRKGIPPPHGVGGPDGPMPQYVPQPAPVNFNSVDLPPGQGMPPPGQGMPPPGTGMPPPGGFDGGMGGGMGGPPGGGMPAYNPNMGAPAYPSADIAPAPEFQPGPPMDPQNQPGAGGDAAGGDDDFAARLANLKNM